MSVLCRVTDPSDVRELRFGVTGHRALPVEAVELAKSYWNSFLPASSPLRAVSSLADGADQLFAEYVLGAGGTLEVILPCAHYDRSFSTTSARARFRELVEAADRVITLPYQEVSSEAFMAAGLVVVERCDCLFAIWDGREARGLGGTADVVAYARARGRAVRVLWPDGLTR